MKNSEKLELCSSPAVAVASICFGTKLQFRRVDPAVVFRLTQSYMSMPCSTKKSPGAVARNAVGAEIISAKLHISVGDLERFAVAHAGFSVRGESGCSDKQGCGGDEHYQSFHHVTDYREVSGR